MTSRERLRLLRLLMTNGRGKGKIDAYIVLSVDAHQSEYIADCDRRLKFISNFSGSRGLAAITLDRAAFWTDGRYFLQAERELDASEWILMREGLPDTPSLSDWLISVLPDRSQVAVDPKLITSGFYAELERNLKKRQLTVGCEDENLIDVVWGNDRPSMPNTQLRILPVKFAGKAWQDKIGELREKMLDEKAGLLVLAALDDIAWLFNLRANDIPFSPFFFAYCIVGLETIKLFVDESKVTTEVRKYLETKSNSMQGVQLSPYSGFYASLRQDVAEFFKTSRGSPNVWVPGNSSNYALYSCVSDQNRLVEKLSPIQSMKAMKNDVEIAGMRNAQVKDAVAHCQFLHWLGKAIKSGERVTEIQAAERFESFRKLQPDFMGLSFETISSTGPNTAVIHYKPSPETDAIINLDQMYLIDSGSHFLDGTTDITRTVFFSQPNAYQRECFTRVLKGHIAMARLIMPEKTSGYRLDSIARLSLWNVGLDYAHGTGHGVGHYLSIHEGPAGLAIRSSPLSEEGFRENMIMTIEPGYYEDGKFGIRIENEYLIIPAQTKYKYKDMKFLAFEAITFVPIQRDLIDQSLLSAEELAWINDYHAKCLDTIGPILPKTDPDVLNWLTDQCRPIT